MIETLEYKDFSRQIHIDVNPQRIPVNGTLELTHRCPLECVHCYNNLPMHHGDARRRELSTDDYRRILDELGELGCLWLLLTGGEVLARPDFFDIYRHAVSTGILVTVFTNGTLITERVADAFAEMPPFSIEITLYGRTKATYESLTGIPGSFERAMRGIHLLLERKLPLKLKTVAISVNKHEVFAIRKLAEELGVEFTFDSMMTPRIDCSASPLAVRLTPADVVTLDLQDPRRRADWTRLATEFAPPVPKEGEVPTLYECGGGVNSFAIDPYGDMSICVLSHVDKFNVRELGVRTAWESYLQKVRDRPVTRVTKCTSCALRSLCGSCAANGELENGDPEAPVDFLCRTAHLRAEIYGIDVRPHGECEYCVGASQRHEIDQMAAEVRARHHGDIAEAITEVPAMPQTAGCGPGGCSSCSLH